MAGSHGLVFKAGGLQPRGREFEPQHHRLNGCKQC